MAKISIIGGGAWGTALAHVMATAGHDTILWAREEDVVNSINQTHINKPFLDGISIHPSITATNDLGAAIKNTHVILMVTPAQHLRASMHALALARVGENIPLVICAKGVEIETGLMMSEVARLGLPYMPLAVLTGPTFAAEIARGLPTAVTLAMDDLNAAQKLCDTLSSRSMRMYASDDMVGAQIGGAVKNVIAIACGMIAGKGLGDSARAALVTRGLAEIARLCIAMGGKRETLMGMCGVGDLLLTCSSMQSRNFSLGFALGEGQSLESILSGRSAVTEGVHTAKALYRLAKKHAVDMPIAHGVHQCLSEGLSVDMMIQAMLDRPVRHEIF
jgi:glycerol-3-phosphate dehydrogenase (NAD(P)+)